MDACHHRGDNTQTSLLGGINVRWSVAPVQKGLICNRCQVAAPVQSKHCCELLPGACASCANFCRQPITSAGPQNCAGSLPAEYHWETSICCYQWCNDEPRFVCNVSMDWQIMQSSDTCMCIILRMKGLSSGTHMISCMMPNLALACVWRCIRAPQWQVCMLTCEDAHAHSSGR